MKHAIAFLLLSTAALAEKPTAQIDGPTHRHAGALTFLDASQSAGAESFEWLVDVSAVKVPRDGKPDLDDTVQALESMGYRVVAPESDEEPLYAVSSDGKRLWLSSFRGCYKVVLAVANADGISLLPWTVQVGPAPEPEPEPEPEPDPEPEPLGALGNIAYLGCMSFADSNTDTLKELAGIYRRASASTAAIADVETLLAGIKTRTGELEIVDKWRPVARLIEIAMDGMRDTGTLNPDDPKTYRAPLLDISRGIERAID